MAKPKAKPVQSAATSGTPSVPKVEKVENLPMPTAMKSKTGKAFKKIKEPIPRFMESANQVQGYWAEGEFDLVPIFKLLDQEALFFKACQKKLSQMFQAGCEPRSDDDEINEYLQARFLTMELQTGFSLEDILKQAAYHLIIGSNAFIIKVRDKDFEYASSYKIDGKEIAPVTGLFIAHPTQMKPRFKWVTFEVQGQKRSKLILIKWIFVNRRGVIVEFDPADVVHLTMFKQEGMIFGTPEVIPVIDDISTLRKMEEDVQLLAYRDLFPIVHYQIENPTMIDHEMGTTELDQAKRDLERMMQDGGIATDFRHKISYIGSQGKAMDIKPYIEYFLNRVCVGLGVSPSDFGLGADVSSSTAQNMSKQLIDSVKYFQQEFTRQFDSQILNEVMLCSPFGINGLKKGFKPTLKFEEIDIEWKIRNENHEADQFTKGVKTIDEVRNPRGLKTLDEHHEKRTHEHMFGDLHPDKIGIEHEKIRQGDEKIAQSAAKADLVKKNKTNSNVTKSKRKKSHKDSAEFLITDEQDLSLMFRDAIECVQNDHPIGKKFNLKMYTKFVYQKLKERVELKFADGLTDAMEDTGHTEFDIDGCRHLLGRIISSVDELSDDVSQRLAANYAYTTQASNRVRMADRTEQVRAYNYAYAAVCIDAGIETFSVRHYDSEDFTGTITVVDSIENSIPPLHTNSKSIIKAVAIKDEDIVVQDKVQFQDFEAILNDKMVGTLDSINKSIDDKLIPVIQYIEKLREETSLLADKVSDGLTQEDLKEIQEEIHDKLEEINDTLCGAKDFNTTLANQNLGTIEAIIDSVKSMSRENSAAMQSMADAFPREITVNSAPMEVNITNPPMEVNLTLDQKDKSGMKKKINVIRDAKGQILSAEVEED